MTPGDFSNELDWLAFCYVAEELDPSQRSAFESRLAEDQLTREAVVRAVELSISLKRCDIYVDSGDVNRPMLSSNVILAMAIAVIVAFLSGVGLAHQSCEFLDGTGSRSGADLGRYGRRTRIGFSVGRLTPVIWDGELVDRDNFSRDDFDDQDDSVNWMFAALERDEKLKTGE